jgi:SAM-dependent methyltransferase
VRVPWYTKIAGKLVLSRLPVSYRTWAEFGIFGHGEMTDPEYVQVGFDGSLNRAGVDPHGQVLMELGPGDSVSSAIAGAARGAARTIMVDVSDYATSEMAVYRRAANHFGLPVTAWNRDELLDACNGIYLTNGLASLRSLPGESVDFIWSRATLEHIVLDEVVDTFGELRRVLRPSGRMFHIVDFEDHFEHGLHSLRVPRFLWESRLFRSSGFYTNRLRFNDLLRTFQDAGFNVEAAAKRWPQLPIDRSKLRQEFRDRGDLDIYHGEFLCS